jgi:hypothetical protein
MYTISLGEENSDVYAVFYQGSMRINLDYKGNGAEVISYPLQESQ